MRSAGFSEHHGERGRGDKRERETEVIRRPQTQRPIQSVV